MGTEFDLAGETSIVHPIHGDSASTLSIDGHPHRATLVPATTPGEFTLEIDGRVERLHAARHGEFHFIHMRGRTFCVEAIDALKRAQRVAAAVSGEQVLRAPMPGVVIDVAVAEGAEVQTGEVLMTIESMKLQTAIAAPHDARVVEICLAAGARFEQGATLVRLEAMGRSEGEA